ncbi:hypothetical protein [Duganella sp. Root1480D1]|uniref:hypothetical protein n=1 Tax=Duganella sp. Root1480D1 TaxID=1736471 RepID=UPI000B0AA450|nr:hypothetical protein [Duganella sp. Root1480D1]
MGAQLIDFLTRMEGRDAFGGCALIGLFRVLMPYRLLFAAAGPDANLIKKEKL